MSMLRDRDRVNAIPNQRARDEATQTTTSETPTIERLDGHPLERRPKQSRGGDIIKAAIAVIVVAAAVGAYARLSHRPATPTPSHPILRIDPTSDMLYCITQLAWSPDGQSVAALGEESPCGAASDNQAGLIYVYDAASGKVAQKLHPDALVMGSPAVKRGIAAYTTPTSGPPTVNYLSLTWTPDGQSLILPFAVMATVTEPSSIPGYENGTGLLRLAVGGAATNAVMIDTTTSHPDGNVERWDLRSGQPAMVPAPPAAAAYQWTSDGTLTPVDATPGGPVGAPNSSLQFTVWQPGSLQYQQTPLPATGMPAPVLQDIVWNANIAAISPDGHYYYPFIAANGSLVPPSTQHPFAHEKTLAPHDAVLLTLAQNMTSATSPLNPGDQVYVAWRPDGRVLAELSQKLSAHVGNSTFTISLYDTATGKLVKRLTPNLTGLEMGASANEALEWSPDGKRLLLIDNLHGAITIWGPGALPA